MHVKYTPKQQRPRPQELRITAPPNACPGMQLQVTSTRHSSAHRLVVGSLCTLLLDRCVLQTGS